MFLKFEKWHGCRNDFIVVWLGPHTEVEFDSLQRQAPKLCSRRGDGIGADGIIVLHQSSDKDLLPRRLSVINSDGSLAKTCGNGIRCAAMSVLVRNQREAKKFEIPEGLEFELAGHTVLCSFMSRGSIAEAGSGPRGAFPLVAVEMGVPEADDDYPLFAEVQAEVKRHLPTFKGEIHGVRIGNDHVVLMFDDPQTVEALREIGPKLQKSPHWDGINVHLAWASNLTDKDRTQIANQIGEPTDEAYQVLCWERGAGETPACGSGACSVGAAVLGSGFANRDGWVAIEMPGGRLFVRQEEEGGSVTLAGPAEFVFEGVVGI
jgi:diaminopimelate epimerase